MTVFVRRYRSLHFRSLSAVSDSNVKALAVDSDFEEPVETVHRNYVESRGEAAGGARAMACDEIVDASVQIRTRGAHATRTYKTLTKRHLSDESEFDPSP